MYLQAKVKKKNLTFIYTIAELYIKVTYIVGTEIYLGGVQFLKCQYTYKV